MSLLELRHVSKAYNEKVLALDDVNLTVEKGEWLAVMGPSGSGKSTLMNIIGCMDSATSGEVILDGDVLTDASPEELTRYRRDKIGMVFQQFHMIPYLTAVENIMVAQYYHSMPDRDEAMAALERVGLADCACAHQLPCPHPCGRADGQPRRAESKACHEDFPRTAR